EEKFSTCPHIISHIFILHHVSTTLKQSDAYPSNMSSSYDLFTNLGAVCCSNTAEVRLLTFRKGGKLISVDILLLDEQVFHKPQCLNDWFVLDVLQSTLIHGTINLIQSGR
ncbi:hypothetical protein HID58_064408, partial [Brassica napus]